MFNLAVRETIAFKESLALEFRKEFFNAFGLPFDCFDCFCEIKLMVSGPAVDQRARAGRKPNPAKQLPPWKKNFARPAFVVKVDPLLSRTFAHSMRARGGFRASTLTA